MASEKSADLAGAVSDGKSPCMYIGIGTILLILLVVILVMALRGRTRA